MSNSRTLYRTLNDLQPDASQVYEVHDIHLRRDAVSLTLGDGKLAFLQPADGRVTGAVFTGLGHVIAMPRDVGERRSLARFLGVPILDQPFGTVYLRFTDDTFKEISAQLQAAGSQAVNDPQFAEAWMQYVGQANPAHSPRILQDLLSNAPLPYFYAGIGGAALGPFDVIVDARREEQVLIGQFHNVNGADVYDIWASFESAAGPGPAEVFAPIDYRVDTTIADDMSLSGETDLHLRTVRAGERVVPLELSRNLAVQKVTLRNAPLVYFQNEDLSRRDILRRGNNDLFVVLPAPAKAGEQFLLQITYKGTVISDAGNGVKIVGEHDAWYAHATGTVEFVPYDLSFRWPRRFTLVATGKQVEAQEDSTSKTGRWVSDQPFFVAGFNLGEYLEQSSANSNPAIRVYANRGLEEAILARLRQDKSATDSLDRSQQSIRPGSLPPLIASPAAPSPAAVLKQLVGRISDSIRYFEALNGEFPFRSLNVSQIPGFYGQGWPGLVYLSTYAFLPQQTQEEAGMTAVQREEASELMPFHEVAHQWWGNVVGSASYRDAWIEEAIANYLALLYADGKKPGEHRMEKWLKHFRDSLLSRAPGSDEDAEDAGPLSLGFRLRSSKDPGAYESVVYGKGTWVIHMLRGMIRDPRAADPDMRFRALLQAILNAHRFRALTNREFQSAVEKEMTPEMDLDGSHSMQWFFDQWVFGTGIPSYSVEFQTKPHGKGFLIVGELLQGNVDDTFTAAVPLYTSETRGGFHPLGVVVTTGPKTRFHFLSRSRPRRLLIDPKLTLLCVTK